MQDHRDEHRDSMGRHHSLRPENIHMQDMHLPQTQYGQPQQQHYPHSQFATEIREPPRGIPQDLNMGMAQQYNKEMPNSNDSTRVSTPDREHNDMEKQMQQHLHDINHHDPYDPNRPKLPFMARLKHFTWAWWTLVMSTGGLSLLCFAQPFQFPGLLQIGLVLYIITLILFIAVSGCLCTRFFMYSGQFKASLTHEREGFFFPTFFLTLATLITTTYRYAVPPGDAHLNWGMQVAFWSYMIVTMSLAIGQYSFVFRVHSLEVKTMMPTWILPIFPIMLTGTIASTIASTQPDSISPAIVYSGLAAQGLGISVSFLMYGHMVGRLMSFGLPGREHRPGLFMNVGPPAFTCLAFIGMANGLPDTFDQDGNGVVDVAFIRNIAVLAGVFLWGLSFWWWGIACVAILSNRPKYFHLGWWASVFPNTGFTLATITVAKALDSDPIRYFATFMSVCIFITYAFVLYHNIRAVVKQEIMGPGLDEDVVDH